MGARRRTQRHRRPGEQAGTRGSQAAVSLSVLAVLLLLKLGHQAELPAAAAFGEIRRRVLHGKQDTENQTERTWARGALGSGQPAALFPTLLLLFFLDFVS